MDIIQLNRPARLSSVAALQPLNQPPNRSLNQAQNLHVLIPSQKVCCCYVNHTAQFQIVRVATVSGDFIERTVLPHTKVLFEANLHDRLEVHTGNLITSILSDTIPCSQLIQPKEFLP